MARDQRPVRFEPCFVSLLFSLGLCLVLAGAQALEAAPEEDLPAAGDAEIDPFTSALLEEINVSRIEEGRIALEPNPDLGAVAQSVMDEMTIAGSVDGTELTAQRLSHLLAQRGYRALRLVMAFAQSPDGPESLVEQWTAHDPGTFGQLRAGELRHLGLGVGDVRGLPTYLLVAAVSAVRHFGEQAEAREDLDRVRRQVLGAVNGERQARGLRRLFLRSELDRAAQAFAEDMLRRGFYGHFSPEGEDVLERVGRTGYAASRVGENIASGQPTVEMVVRGWMKSPDHRANILRPEFREMGLGLAHGTTDDGLYRFLWVQVFGTRR
ncbi:MAG: CAP domain-containing protein [Holophagales bacterium]|nr:CAP domain-containing protein [Holophagales bacterium]